MTALMVDLHPAGRVITEADVAVVVRTRSLQALNNEACYAALVEGPIERSTATLAGGP
jgi:hypothetical protein